MVKIKEEREERSMEIKRGTKKGREERERQTEIKEIWNRQRKKGERKRGYTAHITGYKIRGGEGRCRGLS